jgi:hypothetical protein
MQALLPLLLEAMPLLFPNASSPFSNLISKN